MVSNREFQMGSGPISTPSSGKLTRFRGEVNGVWGQFLQEYLAPRERGRLFVSRHAKSPLTHGLGGAGFADPAIARYNWDAAGRLPIQDTRSTGCWRGGALHIIGDSVETRGRCGLVILENGYITRLIYTGISEGLTIVRPSVIPPAAGEG